MATLHSSGFQHPIPVVTRSCLFFLFADRFIPRLTRWETIRAVPAVVVPSSEALVSIGLLERHLLAVAIENLVESGAVQVHSVPREHPVRRFVPFTRAHRDSARESYSLQ